MPPSLRQIQEAPGHPSSRLQGPPSGLDGPQRSQRHQEAPTPRRGRRLEHLTPLPRCAPGEAACGFLSPGLTSPQACWHPPLPPIPTPTPYILRVRPLLELGCY